ncbi:MAG: DUF1549 domain-containing protein [Planctomycetes bacterium]|nr:DUF1549 domain-containing protein [Planctomycetota bacterium]
MRPLLVLPLLAVAVATQQRHWAFEPPRKVTPAPTAAADTWCRDELDRYVLARLAPERLEPAPAAAPAILLRRLHLVLTGLPPSVEQVLAFLADPSDAAYDRRVDELLASVECAEHLATGWLDLARFADTYGYQSDFACRTWPWRDWLIRAFRDDMPWDRFVRELVAGDLLPDADVDSRTATAFWRLHRQTNEGGSIEAEWRHEYLADRVDTFGTTFLGLTLGCARCHDHKSDPVSQRDYYSLGSFFAIDESGLAPYSTGAVPQPAVRLATAEQAAEIERLQAAVDRAEAAARELPTAVATTPVVERCEVLDCDGDTRHTVDGVPKFTRADPFRIALRLSCPDRKQRAVVLHTSRYTIDSDTQGHQILIEDGRLCWQIVHHWPGSAIAVQTAAELPLGRWIEVEVGYDGSSRAAGLTIALDGERVATEVVRDHLRGPATARAFELGARDRDRGFAGGRIAALRVFDDCVSDASKALRDARRALCAYVEAIPELMCMAPNASPRPRFVLRRGAYDQPDAGQPVGADVPASVLPFGDRRHDRLGLADWLLDPQNPLPARVAVDRLWRLCFGRGLVPTPENLGLLGEPPANQPLLDALAVDFSASRSPRALLRRIVRSATFRQSSRATPALRARDPHNDLLARGPVFRLSAEALRDGALAAAGLLERRPFGPSSKPWQPPGLWRDAGASFGGADYVPDTGADAHRRSLYTYRKRTSPPPDMVLLDAPSREVCVANRQATDTPLQALVFLNDPVFTECAEALAVRALAAPAATPADHWRFVFLALAGREPRAGEYAPYARFSLGSDDAAKSLTLAASTLMASDAVVMVR